MRRAFALLVLLAPAVLSQEPPEYQEAVRLVGQQHWREALEKIRALEAGEPDNPKLLNLEGLALLGSGDSRGASAAFERVLSKRPDFFPSLKNLAILEWNSHRSTAAARTAAALRLNPRDPMLNAFAAIAALERKDRAAAKQHLELAGAARANLPVEHENRLAILLGAEGLYAQSAAVFQEIIGRGFDHPSLRYNLGLAQYLAGDPRAAVRTLEGLRVNKPSSDGLNLLAQAYEKSGETQKAIDTLRAATALDPADENNYLDLANLCLDHNAYPLGIQIVEAGLQHKPDSPRLLFELGLLHAQSGSFDRAQEEFERAGRLEPASALPLAATELAGIQQSRLPEAIVSLREKVRKNGDSPILWYLLGWALIRTGVQEGTPEFAEAQAAFRKSMQYDPKLPYPYIELGKLYMRTGQLTRAVPLLEKATVLAPRDRSPFYQLAVAYRRLDQPERSRQMLARVRALTEQNRDSSFQQTLVENR